MSHKAVEAVLVVYYGPEAHRATYGRHVQSNKYTKDYIQLSRKQDFLDAVSALFPVSITTEGSVPLTYKWVGDSAPGAFVLTSSDRPHLKWETRLGAPSVWKMTLNPSDLTPQTIPGDPSHLSFEDAEAELTRLSSRGAGQPYLLAIKLRDEPTTLHLRAYLGHPSASYEWADINLVPLQVRDLAFKTSQTRALQWALFNSGGVIPDAAAKSALDIVNSSHDPLSAAMTLDEERGRPLLEYLSSPGYGLFFDPSRNHDALTAPIPVSERLALLATDLVEILKTRFQSEDQDDAAAESAAIDNSELANFRDQITAKDFSVSDTTATTKTRGSAQRAFADAVKANYGWRCAITGISSRVFLVASHIVPWSQDHTIRLDPSNGICLSLLVDRAFEKGYLIVENDLTIRINWEMVGDDTSLRSFLEPIDRTQVRLPISSPPRPEFLQRRRTLVEDSQ